MEVRRVGDPSAFLDDAGSLLLADEARHNLLLSLAGRLRDDPAAYPELRLWLVEQDGRPVGAALQTSPHNIVVAQAAVEGALEAIAVSIAEAGVELPGATGGVPEIDVFAAARELRGGGRRRLRMRQRIYRLEDVRPLVGVPGRPRLATGRDRNLLVEWARAFVEEAMGGSSIDDPDRMVDGRLQARGSGFMLWEDGRPASMAGWGGETPNGVRISAVYTPPGHRRRGYGSAVTAAVSADRLAAGRRFCFLYTDLANPTSNKIYADIGYEPVCDSVDYAFEPR
jgi:uncharacterized protein